MTVRILKLIEGVTLAGHGSKDVTGVLTGNKSKDRVFRSGLCRLVHDRSEIPSVCHNGLVCPGLGSNDGCIFALYFDDDRAHSSFLFRC